MKKLFAVMMALVLTMAMVCSASAEVLNVAFTTVTDLEGNALEGDFSDYAGATMTLDDEAMTLVFNDGTNETNYTLEYTAEGENAVGLLATSEDGTEQVNLVYSVTEAGVKAVTLVMEDYGMLLIFSDAAVAAEEAAESVEG